MELNGIKIKKYRARVKESENHTTAPSAPSVDGYKIVNGYLSISEIIVPHGYGMSAIQYQYVFVAEEIALNRLCISGFGQSVYKPTVYTEGEFEIVGELE